MSRPFQVDLSGVIELLSRHIYSSPRVYLRELIQNGVDAIAAAHQAGAGVAQEKVTTLVENLVEPRITIRPATNNTPFTFQDNGIGLTAAEAAELLATVGRSSKRDSEIGLRREGYLGQFGIGLLSCFMVSSDISILSRSRRVFPDSRGFSAIEWVGRLDGTFEITELDPEQSELVPFGTTVTLARHAARQSGREASGESAGGDDLLRGPVVRELAATFAEFLPIPIEVIGENGPERIQRQAPFLAPLRDQWSEVAGYGREILGAEPLAVIPLDVPSTGTSGVAYVLPFAPPPGAAANARMYLSSMLLAERVPDVLPTWAGFVHAVLSTDHLTPTASREQIIAGEALTETQEAIGRAITAWVARQSEQSPETLAELVSVHHVSLRQMAIFHDDLGRVIIPLLPVETSAGMMTIGEYLDLSPRVRYAATVDEFRQVASIVSPDQPVINAGYSFVADLLLRLPALREGVSVEQVEVSKELANLSPVPFDDAARAAALETSATEALGNKYLQVIVRSFEPANLPALYVADPKVIEWIERDSARDAAAGPWAEILSQAQEVFAAAGSNVKAQLCLNWSNRAVRSLASVGDEVVFLRSVRLMYAQAKLSGHHPLTAEDRTMLTGALDDLITLSMGLSDTSFDAGFGTDFPEL